MNSSDEEDMFALSDDENLPKVVKVNPIQDKLFMELHNVEERIDIAKNNIQEFQSLIKNISKEFAYRVKYGEELENDFRGEWVTFCGEPVIESHKEIVKCFQPLTVRSFNQYIIDDKWIVLAALRNATNWCLTDLRFYVALKDDKELHGTSYFWEFANDSIWNTTKLIKPHSNFVVATAVLDIPPFIGDAIVEASGIILYEAEDKSYQTMIPNFQLSVDDTVDEEFIPQFEKEPENSIIVLKSISVDKTVSFSIEHGDACDRFISFLKKYSFDQVSEDVQILRNYVSIKYCILEMISITPEKITVRISARDSFQLSIVLSLLRKEFPDVPDVETKEDCTEAAQVLLEEMHLYLENASKAKIQRAQINTDYFIP